MRALAWTLLLPSVDSFLTPPRIRTQQHVSSMATSPEPQSPSNTSPFPAMPSRTFIDLAQNQFELLANSISYPPPPPPPSTASTTATPTTSQAAAAAEAVQVSATSKIKSIALYLPQENSHTGQLEFVPTALYPCPTSERMFIASEVGSGLPPTMPKTLAKLPGFAHAQSLLPTYPFASSGSAGADGGSDSSTVGAVEEVNCDVSSDNRGSALSVPLYSGSRTVGVVLVWPASPPQPHDATIEECYDPWTEVDKEQISRASRSIAMALAMDADRAEMRVRSQDVRLALEDNLHQVKNPLQAMRTYAKLLQRRIAMEDDMLGVGTATKGGDGGGGGASARGGRDVTLTGPQLLALAEKMMIQSDRVVDLLAPMDSIVDVMEQQEEKQRRLLEGSSSTGGSSSGRVPLLGPSDAQPDPPGALVFSSSSPGAAAAALGAGAANSTFLGNEQEPGGHDAKMKMDSVTSKDARPASARARESLSGSPPTSTLGDVEVEIAFVPDVLEPVIAASKVVAEERGILFKVVGMGDDAELPGVSVCPKSLQEAVANIVDNAIKYVVLGKGGGRGRDDGAPNPNPHIRVSLAPNHEPYKAGVTILVEDNGPGIPHDEREAVFIRGFRGDATRLVPGSGIGLDISQSMISRMGGILDIVDAGGDDESGQMLGGTIVRLVLFRDP